MQLWGAEATAGAGQGATLAGSRLADKIVNTSNDGPEHSRSQPSCACRGPEKLLRQGVQLWGKQKQHAGDSPSRSTTSCESSQGVAIGSRWLTAPVMQGPRAAAKARAFGRAEAAAWADQGIATERRLADKTVNTSHGSAHSKIQPSHACRGPEQLLRRDVQPWGAQKQQQGRDRRPQQGHGGLTLEGQQALAALVAEGLGDHVLLWRLYEVGDVSPCACVRDCAHPSTTSGSNVDAGLKLEGQQALPDLVAAGLRNHVLLWRLYKV